MAFSFMLLVPLKAELIAKISLVLVIVSLVRFLANDQRRIHLKRLGWPKQYLIDATVLEQFSDRAWQRLPPYDEFAIIPLELLPPPPHRLGDKVLGTWSEELHRLWAALYLAEEDLHTDARTPT